MPNNIIYKTVLTCVIAVFIALPLIKIPISVSARGQVRSELENTTITSLISGRVKSIALVKNNQIITKGDTLLVITTEILETQKELLQSQSTDYQLQLADLTQLVKNNFTNLKTGQYQKEATYFKEKTAQIQAQLTLAEKDLKRAGELYQKDIISHAQYEKSFYAHQELQRQLFSLREQQLATWQTQKREIERLVKNLYSDKEKLSQEEKNYFIIASISGRLVNFSGVQTSNFLQQGQQIGEISPEEHLITECLVSPKDIGFINQGQKVNFQIDTYNYNQWGLAQGIVTDIDQNISVNQHTGEAFFRVRCILQENFLTLRNGYQGQISKGMTLTARFYLQDRTLWQLLFDRADNWFNPKLMDS